MGALTARIAALAAVVCAVLAAGAPASAAAIETPDPQSVVATVQQTAAALVAPAQQQHQPGGSPADNAQAAPQPTLHEPVEEAKPAALRKPARRPASPPRGDEHGHAGCAGTRKSTSDNAVARRSGAGRRVSTAPVCCPSSQPRAAAPPSRRDGGRSAGRARRRRLPGRPARGFADGIAAADASSDGRSTAVTAESRIRVSNRPAWLARPRV
jgi:hypothetical protein